MTEDPERHRPRRADDLVLAVLGRAAPVIMVIGAIGIVVGLLAGQSLTIVAVDLIVVVIAGLLRLILRWR